MVKGAPILTGTFNAAARPTVRICKIASSAATTPGSAACVSTLVQFTSAEIQVSTTEEHFKVNWDTEKNPGAPSTYYRVLVNVSGLELGYADVYVASSSKDLKNANDETLATVDGRTVPLKFSIRQGATSAAHDPTFQCNDCVEKTVPANTPTNIVTPSGRAAAAMPALRDELTVTINRITTSATSPCLPLPASIQADGCYDYDAFANGQLYTANFKAPDGTDTFARVEICLDPAKSLEDYQLHKFSPARASEGVVALPRLPSSLTTCPTSGSLYGWRSDGNRLRDLAHFGLEMIRPVARLIGPAVLHAEDPGVGGGAGSFSNIGWARPISMSIASGNNASSDLGKPVNPTVLVRTGRLPSTDPNHTNNTHVPTQGITVQFQVTAGGGTIGAPTAVTDANGLASVPWTLGLGTNTLVATVQVPVAVPAGFKYVTQTFTATGVAPDLIVQSLTHSPASPTTLDQVTLTAVVKNIGNGGAPASNLSLTVTGESAGSPGTSLSVPALDAGASASVSRQLTLTTAGSYTATAVADYNGSTGGAIPEANETNNSATHTFTVTAPGGSDAVIFNDTGLFDDTGMASANNVQLVKNLIGFTGSGPRVSGTVVLMDLGRNSPCTECNRFATFENTIRGAGFTISKISSTAGTLSITPNVKVLFLWTPHVAFTLTEINTLKQFVADGGRIVFVGEHARYYGPTGLLVENAFLSNMGSDMRNVGESLDCVTTDSPGYKNIPASSLRAHQVTSGMNGVRMDCSSVLVPGSGDFPFLYNGGFNSLSGTSFAANTEVLGAVARVNTAPLSSQTSASRLMRAPTINRATTSTTTCDATGCR